jgi:predicted nucleic-acid-binding protein
MKSLDTNLLVRFLVKDDPIQAETVRTVFERAERTGGVFLVTTVVVLELVWVLSAVYGCRRSEIIDAIEQLCMLPILRFENSDWIHHLIRLGRGGNTDLPDLLIGIAGQAKGCETTLTFDRKAARSPLFEDAAG